MQAREAPIPGEMTLRGRILEVSPGLYGRKNLEVAVTEVLSRERTPVRLRLETSLPGKTPLQRGQTIRLRTELSGRRVSPPGTHVLGAVSACRWIPEEKGPSHLAAARHRILKALDGMDGDGADLFGAIALGQRWRVKGEVQEVLLRTGTYHLLAISGVHVASALLPALVFGRIFRSLREGGNLRTGRLLGLLFSVGLVLIYLDFTGESPSALRATLYFFLCMAAGALGRSPLPTTCLAWCVITILFLSVQNTRDLSLALSVLAVAGILLSRRTGAGVVEASLRMSLGALFFTQPVVLWLSGGIPLAGPLGNLIAVLPLGLFLIPAAVLLDGTALLPWMPVETLMFLWGALTEPVLGFLGVLSRWPWAFLPLDPLGCLAGSFSSVGGVWLWHRHRYRLWPGLSIFVAVVLLSAGADGLSRLCRWEDLVFHLPGIGQADCAVIQAEGKTVLIDCGPPGRPGMMGPVSRVLRRRGVRTIDAMFLSHPHPDHTGGLADIAARWPVKALYFSQEGGSAAGWENLPSAVLRTAAVRPLRSGDEVRLGSLSFRVLGPEPGSWDEGDVNGASLQLLVQRGSVAALFTGDASWSQVSVSLGRLRHLDLFKLPHHGSGTGFPPGGLQAAVDRLSEGSRFTAVCPSKLPGEAPLPSSAVVRWFRSTGTKLLFTGKKGVFLRYPKHKYSPEAPLRVDKPGLF